MPLGAHPTIVATPWLRPLAPADAFLPEGPREVKVGGRPALAWVNIQTGPAVTTGAVHLAFDGSGERRTLPQPGRPGFLLPTDRPNVVFLGMGHRLGLLDLSSNAFEPLAAIPDAHPRTIINDGEVVPGGDAVVFGTKDTAFREPIAGLYLWTAADNRVTLLKGEQTCSNGKVFRRTKEGLWLYDIDTPKKKVVEYRLDATNRTLDKGRTAISLTDRDDLPDGMCDVGDGTVVVAFYHPSRGGDGEAVRYELKTGKTVTKYRVPGSPRVTCPLAVYRPTGVRILLTTCDEGMPERLRPDSPNAGVIFEAVLGPRFERGQHKFRASPVNEFVRLP